MKKILVGILSLTMVILMVGCSNGTNSGGNNTSQSSSKNATKPSEIQDASFRKLLCLKLGLSGTEKNGWVLNDENDAYIIKNTIELNLEKPAFLEEPIKSLDGISLFENLKELNVSGNQLENLDVTKNLELQTLKCNDNKITELNITKNKKLDDLEIKGNPITKLNFKSQGENLYVSCNQNVELLNFKGKKV